MLGVPRNSKNSFPDDAVLSLPGGLGRTSLIYTWPAAAMKMEASRTRELRMVFMGMVNTMSYRIVFF